MLRQIGGNIVDFRRKQGISQSELAAKAGIAPTTLNELERRSYRDIRLSTLVEIARALKVPLAHLFQSSDLKLTANDQARLLKASEDITQLVRKLRHED